MTEPATPRTALQTVLHMVEKLQGRLWAEQDRLGLARGSLAHLEHFVRFPDAQDREARLAEAVTDLRIALTGDEVARAEVEAYRDENVRWVLARTRGISGNA